MANHTLLWRSAWLTGAGTGIGESLALLLSELGVTVYISGRRVSVLEKVKAKAQEGGYPGKIVPLPLDTTDVDAIESIFKNWDNQNLFPDLVVLNAGTHDPFPVEAFTAQRAKNLLDVNLQGTLNCLEPVLHRAIKANKGHIAVMASVAGYRGLPTAAIYGASKAALIHMCEAFKLDLTGTQVKLQVINPGFVKTPLTDKNDFEMPCLIEPDDAAQRILKGLCQDQFEITFPKRFTYILKLFKILPYRWYFALVGKALLKDRP